MYLEWKQLNSRLKCCNSKIQEAKFQFKVQIQSHFKLKVKPSAVFQDTVMQQQMATNPCWNNNKYVLFTALTQSFSSIITNLESKFTIFSTRKTRSTALAFVPRLCLSLFSGWDRK